MRPASLPSLSSRPGFAAFRRPGPLGLDDAARLSCDELLRSLRPLLVDTSGALDQLARRADDPWQLDELRLLLHKLQVIANAQPPMFSAWPELQITRLPLRAFRAHGDFDDDERGSGAPLTDPLSGRLRLGHEQGGWLSELVDRDLNAVLSSWGNPMDIVDLQEIPAGAVLLLGRAAPMQDPRGWDGRRDRPAERRSGGGRQLLHLGQCSDGGPLSARPAPRRLLHSYTAGPTGQRLREV
ncbi:hypothetical protein [Roseateles violae]|uniref:Uncharacterized protein n=1 Tax=Roseateles violae TaxID=3058042 RepID=A0ABT8DUN5_9BURK|nr:hypothetical protein [Pelomonas sp. PFR6]MDN3920024.1 hypothetical protein [Pelomonas sp. PFR6]